MGKSGTFRSSTYIHEMFLEVTYDIPNENQQLFVDSV
jgi:hypothetical protein